MQSHFLPEHLSSPSGVMSFCADVHNWTHLAYESFGFYLSRPQFDRIGARCSSRAFSFSAPGGIFVITRRRKLVDDRRSGHSLQRNALPDSHGHRARSQAERSGSGRPSTLTTPCTARSPTWASRSTPSSPTSCTISRSANGSKRGRRSALLAPPGLSRKRRDLRFVGKPTDEAPFEWRDEIEQVCVEGSFAMTASFTDVQGRVSSAISSKSTTGT
jgi:hypothetical protein